MLDIQTLITPQFIVVLVLLMVWEFYWKGRGMWQAARNGHLKWFTAILIFNSAGILPILYIRFHAKKVK